MIARAVVSAILASLALAYVPAADTHVSYPAGPGPGQGKHVVFLAGDEEYRSEEALPMLAKILSQRHGFKCTVLFSVDPDGTINPKNGKSLSEPGGARHRGRHRHVAALPRLARRGHGALRQAPARRQADRRAAHEHARVQRVAQGRPVGVVELQQPGRLREARARRDLGHALGQAQGRGDARRHRAVGARQSAPARRHRPLRRH